MAIADHQRSFPLDPDQQTAVESTAQVVLVNGSAGTGMTQTVVARVDYLIESGQDPAAITCLTSRGSVRELSMRLLRRPRVAEHFHQLFVGDLYQFANDFLRSEESRGLGIRRNYTLWANSRSVAETVWAWKADGRPPLKKGEARDAFNWYRANQSRGQLSPPLRPRDPKWNAIISFYLDLKQSQGAMDLFDVLSYAADVINPVKSLVGASIRDLPQASKRVRHLVVDQGEELAISEIYYLFRMASGADSLLVAYDPNQGVSENCCVEFEEHVLLRFPDAHRVRLRMNHSANSEVSGFLCNMTEESTALRSVDQHSIRPGKDSVVLNEVEGTLTDVSLWSLEEIQRVAELGMAWDDIAILYRRGEHIGRLRTLLAHRGIPHVLLADSERQRPSDGQAVAALLSCLLNPRDLSSLRLAAAPGYSNKRRQLGNATARDLRSIILNEGPVIWQALDEYTRSLKGDSHDRRALAYYLNAMARLKKILADPSTTSTIVVDEAEAIVTGAKSPSQRIYPDRDMTRLRRLTVTTPTPAGESVESHLQRIVDRWALGLADPYANPEGVAIGPIAGAKGQHWRLVFLLDVRDRTIPGGEAAKVRSQLAREARLFYLGLSRAADLLQLCIPDSDSTPGSEMSRFLTHLVNTD